MAETLIENQICSSCGAEIRKGALFCYSCGGAVASTIVVAKNEKDSAVNQTRFEKVLPETSKNGDELDKVELPPLNKKVSIEKPTESTAANPATREKNTLKSAAAMRQKSKNIQTKKVEVVWEQPENAANVWFVLTALVLTLLAAVILFLAVRLN